ncbi:hypothetical protein J6590_038426 [Homalodisca vitripennis]|nr:hypothetical protein J6590_038426 [Homalodisca vitripennis]
MLLRVQQLSQNNRIKQRRAWLLLGWVTAERCRPCKLPASPAVGGRSEVTFKPLAPRLSVRESFLALTSPDKIRNLYFTLVCDMAMFTRVVSFTSISSPSFLLILSVISLGAK